MMKSTLKMLLALAVCWFSASSALAQEPCDCPEDEPVLEYCVLDLDSGELLAMESTACELFCEGYILFWEGPCDVEDPDTGDGEEDDLPGDCDCPEDEEPQEWCVFEPIFGFEFTVVATECELLCEGIFAYSEGTCEGEGDWDPWPSDCDCDYDVYEPVCVTLDDGTQCSFYNACEAECFGYTEYADGECEYDYEDEWPEDCDCPEDEEAAEYCVINLWTGEFDVVTGTECELFCEGFLIVGEGDCEEGDYEDEDGDDYEPCDCEGDEEVLEWCVFDPFWGGEYTIVATECELWCEGIFAYSEGACEDEGDWDPWPTECDCDYDEYAPVCVTLDDGTLCTFFSACEAECFGYTDYTEGECEYDYEDEWPEDCDCPEDEEAADYCVINLWTGEFDVVTGTECELFCEGFLIVGEGDCEEGDYEDEDGDDYEDCDCEDGEVLEWCVFDPFWGGEFTVVATECELWCEGIFAYSEGACEDEGDWDPWPSDCDCDYDEYEPVCVTLEDGTLCTFFNACEAECFGYTEYSEGECEYNWDDEWPTDCDCPEDELIQDYCAINLWTGELEIVTGGECQLFCEGYIIIGDGDCEDIDYEDEEGDDDYDPCDCEDDEEVADFCVINLETGDLEVVTGTFCELICEGFLPVGEGDCEGIEDEEDGDDEGGIIPMAALEDWTEGLTVSDVGIYPNPVDNIANVTFKSTKDSALNVEIYSLTGQLLGAEQWTVNSGQVIRELDMTNLASGLYTVSLTTADGNRTTVQVFKR